ncbi:MAG: hypothetical protein ABJ387_03520 [Balneola sp.]
MKSLRTYSIPFFIMLVIAFLASPLFAQTYNTPVSSSEGASYVRYSGTVDMTADGDSIASHYSQAVYIGDSNQSIGVIQFAVPDVTGTEDINVFIEVSDNRKDWISISTAVKDQLTAGTTLDSLHVVGGVTLLEFKGSVWLRIHIDGQTSNPSNTITWDVYLPKNSGAPPQSVATVENRRT